LQLTFFLQHLKIKTDFAAAEVKERQREEAPLESVK